jgi:hypothetical protein
MQQHVTNYYVDPATKEPSSEQEIFKLALRPLTRLFGELPSLNSALSAFDLFATQ